jgi:N-methylhydantoinase A
MVDMVTIGAGGGSVATIDQGGFLTVGPQSAGAVPGPACYDRGGDRPTVTDAQVVAGILRPARFFGGRMTLRTDKAEAALASLALPGGVAETADAVLRLVNGAMAGAARLVSTARGIDPSDFAIVAFGGGGPLHAALVAEEIDVARVLVPWSPGLASAFGLLVADTLIDLSESDLHILAETTLDGPRLDRLRGKAREAAVRNGLPPGGYEIAVGLDMRYAGQAFELTIWVGDAPCGLAALRGRFEAEHRARYGHARPTIGGRRMKATFVGREALPVNATLSGPAVVEEATSTTLVPPGWRLRCLPTGDLMLEKA